MLSFAREMRLLSLGIVVLAVSACATVKNPSPTDPLESFNRPVDSFNQMVDRVALKPVAQGYNAVVPEEIRGCVTNFFANLDDIASSLNNLLQLKPKRALTDMCRVVLNSTVGLLGLVDVATQFGIERTNEDFGQTLGYWGVGSGPYLVVPFLGPSSVRDLPARFVDSQVDPLSNHEPVDERLVATAVDAVDTRARLIPATDLVDRVALDKYSFVRDAFLARRASQVRDGKPDPVDREFDQADSDSTSNEPAAAPATAK
ncbi:MAG: VacJ family lipoprotein [Limnobacter sp.]|nr:VacJ family lipoprotein [Limnobacter sp.]